MEIVVKHRGEVTKAGKLKFENQKLFEEVIARMNGKRFELVLKEAQEDISVDTYGYFFGGILKTAYSTEQYSWYDKSEDIHYKYFAPKYLMYDKAVRLANGQIKIKRLMRDIKDLSQKEMSSYIERVIIDLAEDQIICLDPSEYQIAKRYKTIK